MRPLRFLSSLAPIAVAVVMGACGAPGEEAGSGTIEQDTTACTVNASRSLVITNAAVLGAQAENAPGGSWHFSTVIDRLFSDSANAFVRGNAFEDAFASRSVRNAWPLLPDGKLDVAHAPFRLVAVVLRPEGNGYLGELRLVYEAYAGGALGELVSLEYAMESSRPAPGEPANTPRPTTDAERSARRKAWIDAWRALEKTPFGTPAYVAALSSLTDAVTRKTESFGRMEVPALRRVGIATRGERATQWTMTALERRNGGLEPAPLTNTPPADWNDPGFTWKATTSGWGGSSCGGWAGGECSVRDPLVRIVERDESKLYDGTFVLPAELRAKEIPLTPESAWGTELRAPDGWTEDRWSRARSLFSRATCDGCHGPDTGTNLHHVIPQPSGDAQLSAFVRDHELPIRTIAYKAALCGSNALSNVTELAANGIQVAGACTNKGEVFSEPCNGGRRYATCVELGGKLTVSERTGCIGNETP